MIFKNMPPNNSTINVFCKCTWNFNQGRSFSRLQTKLNKYERLEIMQSVFCFHHGIKFIVLDSKGPTD